MACTLDAACGAASGEERSVTLHRSALLARLIPFAGSTASLAAFLLFAAPGQAQLPLSEQLEWMPDARLTTDPASSRTEIDGGRNAVVSDQILMTVWTDTRDGNAEIYFKERIAGTWSSDLRLTHNPASSIHPAIGRHEGDVRVVWEDDRTGHPEIWMKRKIMGAWLADSCVTCDMFESARPSLDHTGEHLAWEETKDGNREIYYRRRLESGSWEGEFRVSNDADESSHPAVASPRELGFSVDPAIRIVAWQDHRHGDWEIYSRFGTSFNGWGPEKRVSSNAASSQFPSVAVEDDSFCGDLAFISHWVAWQDDRDGNEEIYFAEGADGFWQAPFRATNTVTPSRHPSVGKRYFVVFLGPFGAGICSAPSLVWEERASGTSGSIHYWDFAADPEVISAIDANPEHASFALFHDSPSPGIVEGNLAVVWTDERDGNPEIYVAEGTMLVDGTDVPEMASTAGDLEIKLAGPNPFRGATTFTVRLSKEEELSVRIVDATGRLVRELFSGRSPSGTHLFAWDGKVRRGVRGTAGVYFIAAESGGSRAAQRVIRLP
jgi:hypothetical protein